MTQADYIITEELQQAIVRIATQQQTKLSEFLRKDGNAWLSPTGQGERGWEEVPYWLKGYANLAFVLDDKKMQDEAQIWLEGALGSQKADGWFGPDQNVRGTASRLAGRSDLWPNMIMLFCLQDWHSSTGDPRVIKLMKKYFRYLQSVPEEKKAKLVAGLEAMGLSRVPEQAFGQEAYYSDWLDTEESNRLLRYQRHSFEDFRRECEAAMGTIRPWITIIRPLADWGVLRYSDAWRAHKRRKSDA